MSPCGGAERQEVSLEPAAATVHADVSRLSRVQHRLFFPLQCSASMTQMHRKLAVLLIARPEEGYGDGSPPQDMYARNVPRGIEARVEEPGRQVVKWIQPGCSSQDRRCRGRVSVDDAHSMRTDFLLPEPDAQDVEATKAHPVGHCGPGRGLTFDGCSSTFACQRLCLPLALNDPHA